MLRSQIKPLYGQFTPFACLVDKQADFLEELKYFATIKPDQPALIGLFSNRKKIGQFT